MSMNDKKKELLIYSVLTLILCLSSMILSILGFSNTTSGSLILNEINSNHKKSVYFSIENKTNCKETKGSEMFFNNLFEGTEEGCNCPLTGLKTGQCSVNDSAKGCTSITKINSKEINVWKNTENLCLIPDNTVIQGIEISKNGYDQNLSIEDQEISNYEILLSKYSVKNYESCPSKTKYCGFLDTLNNKLCLPLDKNCPINDLVVAKQSTFTKKDYEKLDLKSNNDEKIFYSNKSKDGNIVVEIKSSEGKICLKSSYYEGLVNGYILDRKLLNRVGICPNVSSSDKRYYSYFKLIDSYSKYDTYKDNDVLDQINRLPNYPLDKLKTSNYNLYYRSYIGWSKRCVEDGLTPKELDYYRKVYDDNSSLYLNVMIISIFAFLTCFLQYIGVKKESYSYFTLLSLIPFSLSLTCGILLSMNFTSISIPLKIIFCFDDDMRDLFYEFNKYNDQDTNWITVLLCIINYGVVSLLVVACVCLSCNNNESNQTNQSSTYSYGYSSYDNNYSSKNEGLINNDSGFIKGGYINSSNDAYDTYNNHNSDGFVNPSNDAYDAYNNQNSGGFINPSNDAYDTYNNQNSGGFVNPSNDAYDTSNNINSGGFVNASNDAYDTYNNENSGGFVNPSNDAYDTYNYN